VGILILPNNLNIFNPFTKNIRSLIPSLTLSAGYTYCDSTVRPTPESGDQ